MLFRSSSALHRQIHKREVSMHCILGQRQKRKSKIWTSFLALRLRKHLRSSVAQAVEHKLAETSTFPRKNEHVSRETTSFPKYAIFSSDCQDCYPMSDILTLDSNLCSDILLPVCQDIWSKKLAFWGDFLLE